jgi:hypothetical protein
LPEDWTIFVADIKNSTKAISRGQYKAVNLIGAASITLSMQALPGVDFPFVFGGDGASLCIPEKYSEAVKQELGKLIRFARQNFSLKLRVAGIPAKTIYQSGKKLLVGKLEITPGRFISVFRGGGLSYADQLTKSNYVDYGIKAHSESVKELKGLSCRWSPVPAKKGCISSLLVIARDESAQTYQNVLGKIREVLNCSIEEANPINIQYGQYKTVIQALREEYKYHDTVLSWSFFKRFIDIFLAVLIFRHQINPVARFFNDKTYAHAIDQHSDYRKFDDTLRLIMDCRPHELDKLEQELELLYIEGKIFYGLFASKAALMTCFVETTQQGGHLHFIDGGDGGLAVAAKQLKEQMGSA